MSKKYFYVTLAGDNLKELEELASNYDGDYIYDENIISVRIDNIRYEKLKKFLKDSPYARIIKRINFKEEKKFQISPYILEQKCINRTRNRFEGNLGMNFDNLFIKKYLNESEIESSFNYMKRAFPKLINIEKLPEFTYDSKQSFLLKISSNSKNKKKGLFITGGIHGNEWIPPESLIYFVKKLCFAYIKQDYIKIGENIYDKIIIQKIANNINFYIFPLVNPDGRKKSQSRISDNNMIGRKNNRPIENGNFGIDINRNFNFVWDYNKYFSHVPFSSKDPSHPNFIGNCPFSEPESKNVLFVANKYNSKINFFLDIHTKELGENLILYSWGNSKSQTKYPDLNFSNHNYWNKHGTDYYGEYVNSKDLEFRKNIARNMALASSKVSHHQKKYFAKTANNLYLMSGASRDFMESLSKQDTNSNTIHSFMIEASEKSFNPSIYRRRRMINEICASILELCVQIIK